MSTNTMSRIEKVSLKNEELSMRIRGCINIPEVAGPPDLSVSMEAEPPPLSSQSPAHSEDSGRGTGTDVWPSSKYLVHGGPGFSIGVLDSTTGSLECLPVPVPTLSFLEASDAGNFSLSEVTCLTLAGEVQVWAGTEAGTLHVFDLKLDPCLRLSNHGYSKLPGPVSCLRAEQVRDKRPVTRTEVLVGSRDNTLTLISGESDERGSLRNVSKCPRKVIQLKASRDGEESCNGVHCIALVTPLMRGATKEECYWCGCGPSIVILRRSSWKVLGSLSKTNGLPSSDINDDMYVSALEATEYGVWCAVNHSPTMILWDPNTFHLKMEISCCNFGLESPVEYRSEVSCLVYSEPLLLVGTQGGCLLVFSIYQARRKGRPRYRSVPDGTVYSSLPSSPGLPHRGSHTHSRGTETTTRRLDYAVVASIECCPRPVLSIHPINVQGGLCTVDSPYPASASHTLNMIVTFGSGSQDMTDSALSMVQLYEITGSPHCSPMTSPQTAAGRLSTTSLPVSSSTSVQRCPLQDMKAMPPLKLRNISKTALSFLPLKDESVW